MAPILTFLPNTRDEDDVDENGEVIKREPLYLSYTNGNHFDSLIKVNGDDDDDEDGCHGKQILVALEEFMHPDGGVQFMTEEEVRVLEMHGRNKPAVHPWERQRPLSGRSVRGTLLAHMRHLICRLSYLPLPLQLLAGDRLPVRRRRARRRADDRATGPSRLLLAAASGAVPLGAVAGLPAVWHVIRQGNLQGAGAAIDRGSVVDGMQLTEQCPRLPTIRWARTEAPEW